MTHKLSKSTIGLIILAVLFVAYIGYNYYDRHKPTKNYYVVNGYHKQDVVHRDRHCKRIKGGVEIVSKKEEFPSRYYDVCPECFTDEQWEKRE